MQSSDIRSPKMVKNPGKVNQLTEHHFLFPLFAVFLLGLIWGTTWNLIRSERGAAEHAAELLTHEVAETYEAQVVRSLREIDETLKLVKYAYEARGGATSLETLKSRGMLPPDIVFSIRVRNADGKVIATTRPGEEAHPFSKEEFDSYRQSDAVAVSLPWRHGKTGEWVLRFIRRLNAADGSFGGIVTVTVDAAYFVSGYEPAKLGVHGVLGLLGTDGIFRVRRSGDNVTAGDAVDFAATVPPSEDENVGTRLFANPWDGLRRYTSARQLFDFPLAVVVGLSMEEQLAPAERNTVRYLWRAAGGSALSLLVIVLLWRTSRQLALARQREADARVAYAERVEYLAYHDGLTGLPNRSLFSKLLEQSLQQARRHERQLAVLFLDLDRFKHINDTLGHDAGDDLLKEVSVRLTSCLRESDTVARLGGDEFVVLLPELEGEKYVATVAQKMLAAVARPFMLIGQEFRVTVSIGISVYPTDGEDEETLKKNADIAMYQAKEEGKNNFQFYSEELNANSLERLALESGLRRALERNEFELYYQAKRDMETSRITGMEALLRWQHPDLGVVTPMKFLPIAEETGLIVPIGKWVLKTVCQQSVAWQKRGLPPLRMAVNLTSHQFYDESLVHDVATVLKETDMDASLLELEISESMLMHDVEKTMHVLKALKAIGVSIAIDDFGIGYSSLTALKQFPIDTIKIDRSLVRDVTTVEEDKDMTSAIIAMGRTLSLMVVAQGVETKEQVDILRTQSAHSCNEFQGFYFNRPLPAEQFEELMREPPTPPAADSSA